MVRVRAGTPVDTTDSHGRSQRATSCAVSAHRALPNSLDGAEHRAYRALIDAWVADNREATRSGERSRLTEVAQRFDAIITRLLDARRDGTRDDVTSRLMRERGPVRELPPVSGWAKVPIVLDPV